MRPRPQDPASEAALVERCRQNDAEAFGTLVDLYQSRVFGFVRRMVPHPDEAQDLTQEVFIRAFQSFERFDGRANVRTWLFRIAHNLCIDRARKAERRPEQVPLTNPDDGEGAEYDFADSRWEPQRLALDAELQEAVERAIRSMSEKLRGVLLLHDREDLPYDEIAKLLDLPIGTVKSRLFLARQHLQNSLKVYLDREETQ